MAVDIWQSGALGVLATGVIYIWNYVRLAHEARMTAVERAQEDFVTKDALEEFKQSTDKLEELKLERLRSLEDKLDTLLQIILERGIDDGNQRKKTTKASRNSRS